MHSQYLKQEDNPPPSWTRRTFSMYHSTVTRSRQVSHKSINRLMSFRGSNFKSSQTSRASGSASEARGPRVFLLGTHALSSNPSPSCANQHDVLCGSAATSRGERGNSTWRESLYSSIQHRRHRGNSGK